MGLLDGRCSPVQDIQGCFVLTVVPCRSAAGLVPADIVRQHSCSAQIFLKISSACIPDQNPQNILGSQHLFSVYIHTPPGEPGVAHPLLRTRIGFPVTHLKCILACLMPADCGTPQ